jgi:hypothetical protein
MIELAVNRKVLWWYSMAGSRAAGTKGVAVGEGLAVEEGCTSVGERVNVGEGSGVEVFSGGGVEVGGMRVAVGMSCSCVWQEGSRRNKTRMQRRVVVVLEGITP